ncbi:hypothetical protein [Actinomadura coerulea]|uniref:Uncharacterized protein n=1 Tax=Actinomadura coerulea TaxID=46159 RepID=A0A7X0KYH0_9ACTN|nr:hypothetical protein [Actinomadura coerulea]MBB6395403.1 hypothetical protein [Actinomadura coerulea]GGQ43436.1 hypothetical protein GCM10010187_72450 [Actinomadura coerulea]
MAGGAGDSIDTEGAELTTPEENAPKTEDTDQVKPEQERKTKPDVRTELGAELEDKMAEKGLSRDDFTES